MKAEDRAKAWIERWLRMTWSIEVQGIAASDLAREIERAETDVATASDVRAALRDLLDWADEYCETGKTPAHDAVTPARKILG